MDEKEEKLRECLMDRYLAGAKTLVLDREETSIVINLLTDRKKIRAASEVASGIIKKYTEE